MSAKEYIQKGTYGIYYYRDQEKAIKHRERGLPALEWSDGDKVYRENNKLHRLNDVASDYCKCHYLNGKRLFTKNK